MMQKARLGLSKSGRVLAKNSPLILTGLGIVGLGATAVLAYRSAKKVETIMDDIEESEEVDKKSMVINISKAVALPAFVGLASVTALGASYYIMNNRVLNLSAALSSAVAEHEYYRRKYAEENGEEKAAEFDTRVHEEIKKVVDKNGKEKEKKQKVKDTKDSLYGEWFDKSSEYASDDFSYNQEYIRSVEGHIQNMLFRRGYVLMNEVRDALGFERNRAGALVGYSSTDNFFLGQQIVQITDEETGELRPEIYVKFPKAHYIYDTIDYKEIVNPFGGWGMEKETMPE